MSLFDLDILTIIVLLFLGNITVVIMLATYKSGRVHERSYWQFIAGKCLQAFAWPLLGLRGQISDIVSANIGNSFLIAGFALETLALAMLNRKSRGWEAIFASLAVLGIAAFWFFADSPGNRVGVASLATVVLYVTASAEMIRTSKGFRLRLLLGLLSFLLSVFLVFRAALGFLSHTGFSLMTPHLVQSLSFLQIYLLLLVGGVGFLLMLKEQDDRLLAESEEKYRTLVDKANEAIVIVQDGKFVYTNPLLPSFLGIPDEKIIGTTIVDVIHPDDRMLVLENYEKRLSGDNPASAYDFRLKGSEGKETWVTLSASRIQWKGRPATLSLLTDITERKAMEQEREKLIGDLQKALSQVKTLSGLLPICASCKKIRDDKGYWNQIEVYISQHADVDFSHSLCPDCASKLYSDMNKHGTEAN